MMKLFGGSSLKEVGMYFNIADENDDKNISLKEIFLEMDIDASGYVDSQEWGRQLNAFKDRLGNFFMGKSLPELGKMFNKIDANHDDKISWDEIQVSVRADADAREEAEELLKVSGIDAVNDDSINFLEKNLVFKK